MAALRFKELGNEYVRKGKKYYSDALGAYSMAILQKSSDDSETSVFYSNRAQVHLYMENYTRAFWDAEAAAQLCPTNFKAYYRAVKASLALGLLGEAKLHCDKGRQLSPDSEDLKELAEQIKSKLQQAKGKAEGSEEADSTSKASWSKLPIDVLMLIVRRFIFAEDYVRFGMVCKPWREASLKNGKNPCSLHPWVVLPEKKESDLREFYCPFNEKVYEIYLPELRGTRCWGSSQGWLVTLGLKHEMHLLDPFSRVRILLPPLHKCPDFGNCFVNPMSFRDDYVYRVILSSDPLSGDCMVMAVFIFGHLNFARPGDEAWTSLKYESADYVYDAMYLGGQFYVFLETGAVVICDSSGDHLKTLSVPSFVEFHEREERVMAYTLEIGGHLFVIARHMYVESDRNQYRTSSCKVHRLDARIEKWEEVKTLGDWSVFVGNNQSFAIRGSDYPGCPANCIYFTDSRYNFTGAYFDSEFQFPSSYDAGIYCLDNHTMLPLLEMKFSRSVYSLPVWNKPVLWGPPKIAKRSEAAACSVKKSKRVPPV